MALSPWYYKTRKAWAIGPITKNGARISGISTGTMVCHFYASGGTTPIKTVTGTYAEVSGQDYFNFEISSSEQAAFTEGNKHDYEHVLTVSSQEYMPTPSTTSATDWKGNVKVWERKSDE